MLNHIPRQYKILMHNVGQRVDFFLDKLPLYPPGWHVKTAAKCRTSNESFSKVVSSFSARGGDDDKASDGARLRAETERRTFISSTPLTSPPNQVIVLNGRAMSTR